MNKPLDPSLFKSAEAFADYLTNTAARIDVRAEAKAHDDGARVAARRAAAGAKDALDIEAAPPVLTPQEAHAKEQYVVPPMHLVRATNEGGAKAAIAKAPHRLKAELDVGGQEQFYLEGQISYA